MKIAHNRITNVLIGGIEMFDAPDFCDAYVEMCDIDGEPATEEQLDAIANDYELNAELVQENVWDQML